MKNIEANNYKVIATEKDGSQWVGLPDYKFIEEKYNQAIVVLTALVAFQEIYEKRTRDVLPFNDFYRERIMRIINAARNIIKE
jgi:hypothetical protein